jgi:putative phosphoribosyl transferase
MSCERIQPHLGVSRGHEMKNKFDNRAHAGRLLARQLAALALHQPVVVALPRGGVPVAAEVAAALRAPLDVLLVQKIGAPTQPEVAVAAMSDGAEPHLEFDEETLAQSGTSRDDVLARASQHLQEIERRRALYLEGRPPLDIKGRTVVLVDDGVATGTTARAGIRALRERKPRRVVLAVPVAPASALPALRRSSGRPATKRSSRCCGRIVQSVGLLRTERPSCICSGGWANGRRLHLCGDACRPVQALGILPADIPFISAVQGRMAAS